MVDLIAGIETGGTKIVCALAHSIEPRAIIQRIIIPTREPAASLAAITDFLSAAPGTVSGIGIASFGPLDLDRTSATFGHLTSTPKLGWEGTDVFHTITQNFPDAAADLVTDVNGSALGEARWGAGRGHDRLAYVTVGTGVGGGFIHQGQLLAGSGWPEIAHTIIRRHGDDAFAGNCPFHADCLEGLASGPAITARWGVDGSQLDPESTELNLRILSYYLAQLCVNLAYTLGIELVVMGGGVAKTPGLLARIETEAARIMGLPGANGTSINRIHIVPPELGDDAGVLGALLVAQSALLAK